MSLRLVGLIVVMVAAMAALLAAFALSLSAAGRRFEHALIAQRETALVEAIARDAADVSDAALRRDLAAYRALIAAEGRYLPASAGAAQGAEQDRAAALAAMAEQPGARPQVTAMVARIAADERQEVAQARADLAQSRRDTETLGALLALAALAAMALGVWQLLRANRDLAAEVAARTADLRSVDASRRLFFAKASHEMRTPVAAIRALAEVAMEAGGDPGPVLADIVAQTGFLGHRIADMLALASAAEGRPELALAPCDLGAVLAEAVAQAMPYARSMEVGIAVSAPSAPVIARADPRWLTQAVLAVIDNGLKFSDPGGTLDLSLAPDNTIAIADNGPGVLPRELPRIFDAYYQAEEGRMRGGSGLGLALARWVVEQHGGGIHAENPAAGGCRIVIHLPGGIA